MLTLMITGKVEMMMSRVEVEVEVYSPLYPYICY